jgi:hypothetical protein
MNTDIIGVLTIEVNGSKNVVTVPYLVERSEQKAGDRFIRERAQIMQR